MNLPDKIPFFFHSHPEPGNGGYPEVMPFQLYFDRNYNMWRQKPGDDLKLLLKKVYDEGSLADGSISNESGQVYVEQVIDYLFDHFAFKISSKVLEIGFGSGILLKKLKEKGCLYLTGIEPGNHNRVEGIENINLVADYFPSSQVRGRFDLIYTMLVLEHLEEPVSYLKNIINSLNENGKIIFAVPNCEPYLAEGDLSIFIHEHFSYFTRESIKNIVAETGFNIEDISVIEGALVVTISEKGTPQEINAIHFPEEEFVEKVDSHLEKLKNLFSEYSDNNVAVYAPIRALNALYVCGKQDYRLIDDSSELHKRYLPGMTSPVESFTDLCERPPDCLLIYSRTFGNRIKQKCLSHPALSETRILTLNDLEVETFS